MNIMVNVQTGNMLDVIVDGKSIGIKQRDSDHRKYEIIWLPKPEGLRDALAVEIKRLNSNDKSTHTHCWHDRVDAAPLCCHCEDLPHEICTPYTADFRTRAINLCNSKAVEWDKADNDSDHGDQFLRAKAIAARELATELEKL